MTDRGGEVEPASEVAGREASLEDQSDVVDFQLDPLEPLDRLITSLLRSSETPGSVVLEAPLFENVHLIRVSKLEAGIFAHRFVQPIARKQLDVLFHHEGFVDQR